MSLLREFWKDESGLVMSAEVVTLGTVGVLGAIVGLNAVGTAVNDEMKEMASAIRSLDQSYGYLGQRGCRAWTAGSCYIQPNVQQSLAEINEGAIDIRTIHQQVEEERKAYSQGAVSGQPTIDPAVPTPTPTPTPLPNQIPDTKKDAGAPTTVPAKP